METSWCVESLSVFNETYIKISNTISKTQNRKREIEEEENQNTKESEKRKSPKYDTERTKEKEEREIEKFEKFICFDLFLFFVQSVDMSLQIWFGIFHLVFQKEQLLSFLPNCHPMTRLLSTLKNAWNCVTHFLQSINMKNTSHQRRMTKKEKKKNKIWSHSAIRILRS